MRRKLLFAEKVIFGDGKKAFNSVVPLKIAGAFSEQGLHDALKRIQEKHALLKAFIEIDEQNSPWFVVNENAENPIPVRIVPRITNNDWEAEVTREWLTPFDTSRGPLMRVIWVKGEDASDLILVMHHCLCDGRTALSILADLLKVLDDKMADIGYRPPILSLYDIVPAEVSGKQKENHQSPVKRIA